MVEEKVIDGRKMFYIDIGDTPTEDTLEEIKRLFENKNAA